MADAFGAKRAHEVALRVDDKIETPPSQWWTRVDELGERADPGILNHFVDQAIDHRGQGAGEDRGGKTCYPADMSIGEAPSALLQKRKLEQTIADHLATGIDRDGLEYRRLGHAISAP